jgi:uncharacterized membrane protein YbjE (DUF340 family)
MFAEIQWNAWQIIIIVGMVLAAIVIYDKGWPWQNKR